jgi:hypothetical protein
MSASPVDETPATAGAQRQIDEIRGEVHRGVRAMRVAGVLFLIGLLVTAWQVYEAFGELEAERLARIGGQSSINAYFCRKIDDVGNGVAALVAVSLASTPPRGELSRPQREGYDRFREYLAQQRRPPRCRQVALQLAILTGADPDDVTITPLRLRAPHERSP